MEWQSLLYTSPAILSAIGTATIAVYIWLRHRSKLEARTLVVLMLSVALWSLLYSLELGCSGLPAKIFWAKLKYSGLVVVPAVWLSFTFEYTGRGKWLSRRNLALLAIVPIGTLLLIWTNDIHHLFWTNATLYAGKGFLTLSLPMGIGFWLWVAYSHPLVLLGALAILEAFVRSHGLYRKQAGIMLIGSIIPWLGNIGFIIGLTPFPHLDLAPFAFTITCLVFALGLLRFRLLDIVPVANDAVIASMSDAVMVLDAKDRFVNINPAAESLIGSTASEAIGRPVTQVWSCWPEKLERSHESMEDDSEIVLGDGENKRTYELRISPQLNAAGLPTYKVVMLHDINERRHAEEALIASEANYKAIFNTANDAIFVHDIETGAILDVNQKMCELYGYTAEEARELSIESLSSSEPPYTQEDAVRWIQKAAQGEPQLFEWMAKDKGGRLFWVEVNLKRATISGKVRLLATVRDITERKQVQEALQETDRRYRLLAQNVTDVIWTMELQTLRFTYVSPSVTRLRGYRSAEAMAQSLQEVLTPESLDVATKALEKELDRQVAEPAGSPRSRTLELQQLCKDGSTVWTEVTVTFLYDSDGKPVELLGVTRDIKERKRADEALRRNEEHFRSLIENALDAIGIIDGDGTILYESPSIERILGYKPESVVGRNSLESVRPDDRQRMANVLNQARNNPDATTHEEFRCRHRDGSWRVLEIFGKGLPNTGNLVVNYRDITERKLAEDALKKSEQEFRLTFESAKDAIIWADPETGLITNCNKATEILLEKDRADIIGHNQTILHPPQKSEYYIEMFRRHLQEKGSADDEAELITKSGKIVPVHITASVASVAGRPIIQGIFRDISEHRRAEEALQESERSYRLLAENVSDVIWTSDLNLKFHYVSPSTVQIRGYSVEEVMSQSIEEVVTPDSLELAGKVLAEELAMEEDPQRDLLRSRTMELEQCHKDGSTIWTETKMTFIRDPNNRAIGILGITRDITEQRQLRQQLLQAQKMESIGTLAGGIAHDFNNLLAGILGYASLTKTKIPREHQVFSYIDTIEKSATRAAELTSQLLAFARGGKYESKSVNLNGIVRETVKIIERTFEKSIEIDTHLIDSLPTVAADAGQLQQVLMNLCVNARDALPDGGKLIIETNVVPLTEDYAKTHAGAKPGLYVNLSVTDTGLGMDKATMERIFEPFFTTKEKGKGTGLGLAMVYGVVKNHGGYINVHSEPGEGSTFKVYLPVSGKPVSNALPGDKTPRGGDELILVVDDEESVRSLARDMLESHGYRVLLAENGEKSIEILRTNNGCIDIVILDMVMPKMGGRETFLKMKEMNPKVKVLLSTGYSQDGKAKEILDSGVMGFLQKPYQVNALLTKVRSILDGGLPV